MFLVCFLSSAAVFFIYFVLFLFGFEDFFYFFFFFFFLHAYICFLFFLSLKLNTHNSIFFMLSYLFLIYKKTGCAGFFFSSKTRKSRHFLVFFGGISRIKMKSKRVKTMHFFDDPHVFIRVFLRQF
jgi:hypothetical protein